MVTLLTNGPASNRFNIVFLSEGYTSSQMPQFLVDATNALSAILSWPPWQSYSNYVNAYAIRTNSVQSGSDHPVSGISCEHGVQQLLRCGSRTITY